MHIKKIKVIQSYGMADLVCLQTDLPSSMPGLIKGNLTLEFHAEKDTGLAYTKKHFPGIAVEVIKDNC